MNPDRSQERAATFAGFLQFCVALGCYLIGQRYQPTIPIHYIAQTGNILFVSSLVSFLAAFHAYLARLAYQEKKEKEVSRAKKKDSLFETELGDIERYERSIGQFEKIIIPALILLISCGELALTSWVVWMETNHVHELLPEDRSIMLPFTSMVVVASGVFFIVAKYCTGLAFGDAKHYLRPVSGYTLYGSGVCALDIVVSLLFYWGYPVGLSIATWLLCGLSIFLSIERIITWIVDLYRPQSTRVRDLPVYESRFLGLFCQPQGILKNISDLVDYQFGFAISERLIYRCFAQVVLPFILLQVITLTLLSCIVYIQPNEQGIVQQWGADSLSTLDAGLHFKMPWPICSVSRIESERIQLVQIPAEPDREEGEDYDDVSLWDSSRFSTNLFLAASFRKDGRKPIGSKTDSIPVNLASVNIRVHYRIANSLTYYIHNRHPKELIRHISLREIGRYMIAHDFPSLVKFGIDKMSKDLGLQIQRAGDSHNLGIRVLRVDIDNLQPPPKVALSYREVVNAQEERNRKRIEAEQYEIQVRAKAEQEANRLVKEAESDTALITSLAEVEKANYSQQYTIYKKYPQLYKTRSTMDALEEWLREVRKFVVTTGDAREVINLELKRTQPDLLSLPLE